METRLPKEQEDLLRDSVVIVDTLAKSLREAGVENFDFDVARVLYEGREIDTVVVWLYATESLQPTKANEVGVDLLRAYSKLSDEVKRIGLDIRYHHPEIPAGDPV